MCPVLVGILTLKTTAGMSQTLLDPSRTCHLHGMNATGNESAFTFFLGTAVPVLSWDFV